jgi:hypothetical protein
MREQRKAVDVVTIIPEGRGVDDEFGGEVEDAEL